MERFVGYERFNAAFEVWHERPRKVALRAGEEEFARAEQEEPCAVVRDVLLCLP